MRLSFLALIILASSQAFAADLAIPNSFSADTPARSAEVNANFSAIETAVNDKQEQLSGTECVTGEALQSIAADGTGSCVEIAPERTGYLSLPGEAFVSSTGSAVQTSTNNGGAWAAAGVNTYEILVAPVYLPQGARITELRCWMRQAAPAHLETSLNRRSLADSGITTITALATSDYSSSILEFISGPLNEIVDNSNNSYLIRVRAVDSNSVDSYWPGNNALQINAVRITYTY